MTTEEMLGRLRTSGYPATTDALYVLERRGYLPPRLRHGRGRWRREEIWGQEHFRALLTYHRLRRKHLHGRRLGFACWWETGREAPGARRFLEQVAGALSPYTDGFRACLNLSGVGVISRPPRDRLRDAIDQMQGEAEFKEQFLASAAFNGLRTEAETFYSKIQLAMLKGAVLPAGVADPDTVRTMFTPWIVAWLGVVLPAFLPYLTTEDIRRALRETSSADLIACRRLARGALANLIRVAATRAGGSRRTAVAKMRKAFRMSVDMILAAMGARRTRRFHVYLLDTAEGRRALLVLAFVIVRQFIEDHWEGDWTQHLAGFVDIGERAPVKIASS